MPFRIGLSGLNAAQADLKITGNNIANVGTVGFKQSRAEFADVYATSKFGSANTAIGSGVRLATAAQQFTQGNILFTENNLDMGITGDGFFSLDDVSGNRVYTRNGQFKVDKDGFIIDNSGSNLKGYGVDTGSGIINTGDVVNLQIVSTNIPPEMTTSGLLVANIDASEVAFNPVPAIDPDDPTTYTHTTSLTSYDSLGNSMLTSLYFQKTGDNIWTIGVRTIDSAGVGIPLDTPAAPPVPAIKNTDNFSLTYSTSGTLETISAGTTPATPADIYDVNDLTVGTGEPELPLDYTTVVPTGAAPQLIAFDIGEVTQYGANFGVTNLTQDGFTTGQLSGIDVDQSGIITARFTNGQSNNLGQIFLTNFTNNQGLGQLGDNYWSESFSSGQGIVNTPGSGNAGLVNSGALEDSNVDLTAQLINLITAQRNFQANAKTITTADTITQTLIQI